MSRTQTSVRAHVDSIEGALWTRAAWVGLLAAWLFVFASLLSFDPADPPTHVIWPANDPVHNWCGPVGAQFAYHTTRLLGVGAWLVVVMSGIAMLLPLFGRRLEHPLVRGVGVLLLAVAAGCFQALLLPRSGPFPGLAGGTIGAVGGDLLSARFGMLGSLLWVVVLTCVGGLVAFDRWILGVPLWLTAQVMPRARDAGAKAGGSLMTGLGAIATRARPVGIRLDDLDDVDEVEDVEIEAKPTKRKKVVVESIDEEAGGLGAVEAFDPDAEADDEVEDEYEEDEYEEDEYEEDEYEEYEDDEEDAEVVAGEDADEDLEEDEIPGAPQVFSEDALREKISKLPVRFAQSTQKLATEEDLQDLQNVAQLEGYRFPGVDLLVAPEQNFSEELEGLVRDQAQALEQALEQYRIDGNVVGIESGPVITLYHVRLAPGTKVANLNAVSSDIARSLKAINLRIVANMAGRDTVGIEVPNPKKEKVRMKELMSSTDDFKDMRLPMFLGKDASGDPLIADLTKMPHMLIAGTTGSGKSVCINTIIMSFLYTKKPNELKLVLVDPKMVEMSQFKDIPHLMCPVVTEMSKAAAILEWAVRKMDERYELLAEAGCRDIAGYNALTWEELKEAFNPQTPEEEARIPRRLPYMVFVIDELADLMMTNKEVEGSIVRIAQKARAVGMHLILATQRPQANVVTGLIKSNMPCRIAFKVSSGMDSRIVLDQKGGELLLGQGDMLYLSPSSHKVSRAQGTLVDDKEIRRVVKFMRDVATPTFERQLMQLRSGDADEERLAESENNSSASLAAAQEDPLFDRAVEIVLETKRGSVSLLQRRLAIGYTRASRLIDLMGIAGIIGEHKGSVAREVMITAEEWAAMKELAERDSSGDPQGELFEDPGPQETDADRGIDVTDGVTIVTGAAAAAAILAADDEDDDPDGGALATVETEAEETEDADVEDGVEDEVDEDAEIEGEVDEDAEIEDEVDEDAEVEGEYEEDDGADEDGTDPELVEEDDSDVNAEAESDVEDAEAEASEGEEDEEWEYEYVYEDDEEAA